MRARLKAAKYEAVVAFRPSGWCVGRSGSAGTRTLKAGPLRIHEVPYSEHSSFSELQACVRDLQPTQIIPTVGCAKGETVKGVIERLRDSSR